jgi:hypothetical protein
MRRTVKRRLALAAAGVISAAVMVPATGVSAATFTVTNAAASGAGSLTQALLDAASTPGPDVITFDPATNGLVIPTGANVNGHDVTITGNGRNATILSGQVGVNTGAGAAATVTVTGLTAGSINVNSGFAGAVSTANFTDVTLVGGGVNVNSGFGSSTSASFINVAVTDNGFNINSGFDNSSTNATLSNVIVTNGGINANSSESTTNVNVEATTIDAGPATPLNINGVSTTVNVAGTTFANSQFQAIRVNGKLNMVNSTVSGFTSDAAIQSFDGVLDLQNVTIADNANDALDLNRGSAVMGNTIIAANGGDACAAPEPLTSRGGNLVDDTTCGLTVAGDQQGVDPLLGPLADNGGPTRTHLPGPGSPAIDGGVASNCPATDQRGVARPQDGDDDGSAVCDAGAVEVEGAEPLPIDTTPTTSATGPGTGPGTNGTGTAVRPRFAG